MNNILDYLNKPISSVGIGAFRVLFGLIMLWEVLYFYRVGLIENFIFLPATLFNYEFLPVSPLDEFFMKIILAGMLISTALITVGILFRYASLYLCLSLSYILLLDKGLYNNHIFLICLLSLMLVFTNSDAAFSLSKKRQSPTVPYWQYLLLQVHVAMVYFFGGIAKINPYWLNMHPVKEILEIRAKNSGLDFISSDLMEYFIMYGGLIFDLCIPFLLWYRKTRTAAIILALLFNLTNAWIFRDINIFPFFMIASLILFMDQEKVKGFISKYLHRKSAQKETKTVQMTKAGIIILVIYFIINFSLPFRHFLYPGYVDWTGEAQHFAWRMKIQHRQIAEMSFAVFDIEKKEIHEIEPKNFINMSQYQQMSLHPRMVIQFAEFLEKQAYKKLAIRKSMVKSKVKVRFNGSEPVYMFDPEIDLLEIEKSNKPLIHYLNDAPPPGNY